MTSIIDDVSAANLAEVVAGLLPPEPIDPTGPEVLECGVVLLSRMAREHCGEVLGSVADRVANLLHLGVRSTRSPWTRG